VDGWSLVPFGLATAPADILTTLGPLLPDLPLGSHPSRLLRVYTGNRLVLLVLHGGTSDASQNVVNRFLPRPAFGRWR
jgi:hypothetical protein